MESVNINDQSNSSLVPAPSGKGRKGAAHTALFDRMFSQLQAAGPVTDQPQTAIVLATAATPEQLTDAKVIQSPILDLIEQQSTETPALKVPEAVAPSVETPVLVDSAEAAPAVQATVADVADVADLSDQPVLVPADGEAIPEQVVELAPEIAVIKPSDELSQMAEVEAAPEQIVLADPDVVPAQVEVTTQMVDTDPVTTPVDGPVAAPVAAQIATPQQPVAPDTPQVAAVAQPEATLTQPVDGDVIISDTDIETVTALDDAVATVVDEPMVVAAPIIAAQLTRTVNTADKPVQPQPTAATQKTAQPAAMTQVAASQQRAVVTDSKPQMQAKSDVATSDTPEFEMEQSVMPLRRRFVTAPTETAKVEPTKTVEITPQVSTAPVQTAAATAAAQPVVDVPAETPTDTQSAEGAPSLDTNDAAWVETLSAQIEANFTDTGGEIELQLTPENLGQLRIRLEVVDGAAQVTIVTESTDAARLFQQNEAKLSELLAKSGLNLTDHNASAERQDRRDGQPNGQGIANANGRSGSQDGETTQINMTSADNGLVNLIA